MSDIEPISQTLLATLRRFLATSDPDVAAQFADAHQDLHDPKVVALLVAAATTPGITRGEAQSFLDYAVMLTGSTWSEGPELVAAVAMAESALDDTPYDRGVIQDASDTARRVLGVDRGDVLRPTLWVRLLRSAASILAHGYVATGDRAMLEEAIEIQRRAVDQAASTSEDLPGLLANLASRLRERYAATADLASLDEAVGLLRRAVASTPLATPERPNRLNNLALTIAELYSATGDRGLLDEAVAVQRRAVEATVPSSPELPGHLNNLATRLAELYSATGDRGLLDEAVAVQRRAVEATAPSNAEFRRTMRNLADRLADLHSAAGDQALLDEARLVIADLEASGPWERILLAGTRAALARKDIRDPDRYRAAAAELAVALDTVQALSREESDASTRRDLAQHADGLLSDLVATYVLKGDLAKAVELLEGDRLWLRAPVPRSINPPDIEDPVVWVAASRWETVAVSSVDQRTFTSHVIERTRDDIEAAVVALLHPAPTSSGGTAEASFAAVESLCELAGEIVAGLPSSARWLVIPIGVCALLPYSAAPLDEGLLIDRTAVTLAPSLSWAQAAARPRPQGKSLGVFHPGRLPTPPLNLARDRQDFEELVSGNILDSPTAEEVLAQLGPSTDVLHFSSHGSYNTLDPLRSWLSLETDLSLQAVLDSSSAPWLVNLSASETAIPDLQATDQLISFPTGFLLAGASHVIATLWSISNEVAAAVNRDLYAELAAGSHPADALRQALQKVRQTGPGSGTARHRGSDRDPGLHAFWWAAFVHYGSPW